MNFYFFSLMSLLFSCFNLLDQASPEVPKEEKIVDELLFKLAENLKTKYKMEPIGTSVAMPEGIIKELGFEFRISHPMSRQEAREILIESAKALINVVNNNEEIKPYLEQYPFTFENIDIALHFTDSGKETYDPELATAEITHKKIIFRTNDKEDTFKYKSEIVETIDEAIETGRFN